MKIETVAVGMRSDGRVVMTLTARNEQGELCETAFDMPPDLSELTADDLKAAGERARARLAAIATAAEKNA